MCEFYRAEDGSVLKYRENQGWSAYDAAGNLLWSVNLKGQATLQGTTAGRAISSMPIVTDYYKKFIVYLDGYENAGSTAQTIDFPTLQSKNFPTGFTQTPKIVVDDSADAVSGGTAVTVSTTTLTLATGMVAPVTGWILVEGY